MPVTKDSLAIGLAILARAGINTPEAVQLLNDYPDSLEILVIMDHAQLFNEPVRNNKMLFANLINLVKRLTNTTAKDYNPQAIASMHELYKLLAGAAETPCLLTSKIQACIVEQLESDESIRCVIDIIKLNSPSTAQFIKDLFGNLYAYIRLYKTMRQHINPLEEANTSYLYILQKPNSVTCVTAIDQALGLDQYLGPRKWLDKEIFKILADNALVRNSLELMMGFRCLANAGLLSEYRDIFIQNQAFGSAINILQKHEMLAPEPVQLALINADFEAAYSVCKSLSWVGTWNSKFKDVKGFLLQLLRNPELSQAFAVLKQLIEKKMQNNPESALNFFEKDFAALIESAKVAVEFTNTKVINSMTFFHTENTCSLGECLTKLREKHNNREEPKPNGSQPKQPERVINI